MSFLGPGIAAGGALAGGASHGIELGQQEQARRQQMDMQRENAQRMAFLAELQAHTAASREQREQTKLTQIDIPKEQAYAEALKAGLVPVGSNPYGIPENLSQKYGGAYSGWKKSSLALQQHKDEMALRWAKLDRDGLIRMHAQYLDKMKATGKLAADAGDAEQKADVLLSDSMRTTMPATTRQALQDQRTMAQGTKATNLATYNTTRQNLRALEQYMSEKGIFGSAQMNVEDGQPQPQAQPGVAEPPADAESDGADDPGAIP